MDQNLIVKVVFECNGGSRLLKSLFVWINSNNNLFANGGLITFILIIFSVVAYMKGQFLTVLPLALHLITLFIAALASDFRYIFPISFVLPIVFIFLKCHSQIIIDMLYRGFYENCCFSSLLQ